MLPHGRFTKKAILNKRWRTTFTFIRTASEVNDKGRSVTTEMEHSAEGMIRPASPEVLERLPEGDRNADSISIHTLTQLTAGAGANLADIVLYKGERYLVKQAEDWEDFGFCHAIASLMRTRGKDG